MTLESTGERFMPDMQGETAIEHMHRYLFARELVKEGSAVLDIACGEGYGSALLSAKAASVVGVDVSPAAVEHAREKYGNDRVRFLAGDVCAVPLPNAAVDAIISFETIEHIADHEKMLAEFARVLKPGGIVIISSPDKYRYSVATGYQNEFHVKELFCHEFEELMKSHFKHVILGGQRNLFGSVIDFIDTSSKDISFSLADGGVARFEGVPEAMYLIAIASQEALPEAVRGVCIDHVTASDAFRDFARQTREAVGTPDQIRILKQELDREKVKAIDVSRVLFEEQEKNRALYRDVPNLTAQCEERQREIDLLRQQNLELTQRIERLSDAEQRCRAIESSTTWRLIKPLLNVASKLPFTSRNRRSNEGTKDVAVAEVAPPKPEEDGSNVTVVSSDENVDHIVADIAPFFDIDYYADQLEERPADFDAEAAARHYLREGCAAGLNPCRDFQTAYYLWRHKDVKDVGMNPFWHWVLYGRRERRSALPYERKLHRKHYEPLVSAVVPNFNHARFLQRRFESILNQTYQNIEIIFLDDASSDESLEIAERYRATHPDRIRIVSNAVNSGNVFRQWRKGIDEAKGAVVWICESDDYADERFVEKLIRFFVDPSVQIAFGKIQFCNAEGQPYEGLDGYRERAHPGIWDHPLVKPAGWWFTHAFAVSNVIANVGGCLIRRHSVRESMWERAQSFRVLGDWYLYAEWAGGGQIAYSPDAIAYFCQHGGNTSVTNFSSPQFYAEHQIMIEHLRRKWGVDDDHVLRFTTALYETFQYVDGAKTLGPFETLFDIERVLACRHEQQHILFAVLGFELGGGEILPIELANALVAKGVMVSFLVFDHQREDPKIQQILDNSIPIYSGESAREKGIWQYVLSLHADLIHSHFCYWDPMFFPDDETLPSLPYIVTLHGSYECAQFSKEEVEHLSKGVTFWVYLAQKNLFHLRDHYGELPYGDITCIGNGMATDERPFPFGRETLGIGAQDFILAIASRCIPEKGWKQACEAVLRLNGRAEAGKVHLVLCGTGDALEGLHANYGDIPEIHFLGYQDRISGLYRFADCMLLPTRFPGESFPLTLIQALQVGTPAIATDVGQVKTMMTDNEGNLAGILLPLEADDPTLEAAIMQAVQTMMDAEQRAVFSQRALECGARYDIAHVADQYIEIYRRFRNTEPRITTDDEIEPFLFD
ncbi:glycosyltransferase [Acetobacter sp.]|uniref:glycosyltransferase n=1 Tax=Acetobacter sp. TaxID=440 RepID=UPI0039E73254